MSSENLRNSFELKLKFDDILASSAVSSPVPPRRTVSTEELQRTQIYSQLREIPKPKPWETNVRRTVVYEERGEFDDLQRIGRLKPPSPLPLRKLLQPQHLIFKKTHLLAAVGSSHWRQVTRTAVNEERLNSMNFSVLLHQSHLHHSHSVGCFTSYPSI